jgi:hypothetical protein
LNTHEFIFKKMLCVDVDINVFHTWFMDWWVNTADESTRDGYIEKFDIAKFIRVEETVRNVGGSVWRNIHEPENKAVLEMFEEKFHQNAPIGTLDIPPQLLYVMTVDDWNTLPLWIQEDWTKEVKKLVRAFDNTGRAKIGLHEFDSQVRVEGALHGYMNMISSESYVNRQKLDRRPFRIYTNLYADEAGPGFWETKPPYHWPFDAEKAVKSAPYYDGLVRAIKNNDDDEYAPNWLASACEILDLDVKRARKEETK